MSKQEQPLTPEQRIKRLETQLREANEKAKLFEAMLDVIRKEYGVKLPKKRSGGSSSKGRCWLETRPSLSLRRHEPAGLLPAGQGRGGVAGARPAGGWRWYASRKLLHLLQSPLASAGIQIGSDALLRVLKRAHLLVPPQRAYHKTTNSFHRFYKHPNLLKGPGTVVPQRPEQVWVADITYLPTRETRPCMHGMD